MVRIWVLIVISLTSCDNYLVVSTHLKKYARQIGSFPKVIG